MYVIFPAADVVEESYLALVSQEQSEANPTGLTSTSTKSEEVEEVARKEEAAAEAADKAEEAYTVALATFHSTDREQGKETT
jgi:hypothetical protein